MSHTKWSYEENNIMYQYVGECARQTEPAKKRIKHEEIVRRLDAAGFDRSVKGVAGELNRFVRSCRARPFFSDYTKRKNIAAYVTKHREWANVYDLALYDMHGDASDFLSLNKKEIACGKQGEKKMHGVGPGTKTGPGYHIIAPMQKAVVTTIKKPNKNCTLPDAEKNWPANVKTMRGLMNDKQLVSEMNHYRLYHMKELPLSFNSLSRRFKGGKGYENKSTAWVMDMFEHLRVMSEKKK